MPLKSLTALCNARLNAAALARCHTDTGVQCVFLFTVDAYHAHTDYAARMFFESAGIREDPATGSANAALAAYLREHRGRLGRVVVDQGVEINRPSRIYLDIGEALQVGGKVQPVVRGELTL